MYHSSKRDLVFQVYPDFSETGSFKQVTNGRYAIELFLFLTIIQNIKYKTTQTSTEQIRSPTTIC